MRENKERDPKAWPLPGNHVKIPMETETKSEELSTAEIMCWFELSCWTMVALAPFLYWINGPAVSTDQLVVRTALVTIALIGGLVLRVTKWIKRE